MFSWIPRVYGRIADLLSDIHMSWTKRLLKTEQIRDILAKAEFGDTIAVRSGGFLTSWILVKFFGKFTHVATCVGKELIFDATTPGVAERDMLNILNGYYSVALLRSHLTEEEKEKMRAEYLRLKKLDQNQNIKYDYTSVSDTIRVDGAPVKIQCATLNAMLLNAGRKDYMVPKKVAGYYAYDPNDFYKAKKKFDIIVEYYN